MSHNHDAERRATIVARTVYWHNNRPTVVREWDNLDRARLYARIMKRAKKKVTLKEQHAA